VTVLDVSGSMTGNKLALLKRAMRFVIDNLGPADRLSVVSFSHRADRRIRLARMSDDGKVSAKLAVESLVAGGSTNIGAGLQVASEVLALRRYRNAVTSVILLSDGQDTFIRRRDFTGLVPLPFRAAVNRPGPIHTFGFGSDHDAAAMHSVAEVTGGTFSFIENLAVIQDSFAQCIGGLLSVAMQSVRIAVLCVHPGVRVLGVKSGHPSCLGGRRRALRRGGEALPAARGRAHGRSRRRRHPAGKGEMHVPGRGDGAGGRRRRRRRRRPEAG